MKELMNILKTEATSTVKVASRKFKNIFQMLDQSNKIQESSASMMAFLVDDLLDFAQLNAGKFRKVIKLFDLREAIEEVVQIQIDKAKMGKIKLESAFKF
jgi:signal transduction histidine kinase